MIILLTPYQLLVLFRGPISLMTGYLYLYMLILIYQFIRKLLYLDLLNRFLLLIQALDL